MAFLFGDPGGLIYSTAAQAVSGLYTACSATIVTSSLPSGWVGTSALKNVSSLITTVPSSSGPYYYGFRFVATANIAGGQNLFAFLNTGVGDPQVTFVLNLNGTITAKRGNGNGVVLGTSSLSTVITQNVVQYVEFGMTCNGASGSVFVRINGDQVLSLTGLNTEGSGSTNILACQILGANVNNFVGDIYICDSTGTKNNTFLGDVHLTAYNPTANGTYTQYTPNGAASLYQCVNATTPADSTIFASDSNPGDKMSLALADSNVAGTIAAVILVGRAEKTDSGTRTAQLFGLNNGHEVDGSIISLGTAYGYSAQVLETDPNTGLQFTNNGFNTLEIGMTTVS